MPLTLEKLSLRIFLAFFGWLLTAIFLAIAGWFSITTVITISVLAGAALIISFFVRPGFLALNKKDLLIIIIIAALTVFIGVSFHDLPLGRDPVSYSVAAIKISETGSLSFQDILTRPYHGFTALGSDNFTSQFLPGYNVYLAIWYALGGMPGMMAANSLLVFFTLLAIYLVAARLSSRGGGLAAVCLTASFYAFLWFSREWASENLLALSFFSSALFLAVGIRERKSGWVFAGSLPAAFSILVRGEGLLYFGFYVLAALIALIWWRRQFDWTNRQRWWLLTLPALPFIAFQFYSDRYGTGYVFEQGESIGNALVAMFGKTSPLLVLIGILLIILIVFFVKFFFSKKPKLFQDRFRSIALMIFGLAMVAGLIFWWWYARQIPIIKWSTYRPLYVLEVFNCYFLGLFLAVAYLGLIKRAWPKLAYLLVLLAVPALVFVLDPYIALDHPWFLRRFVAVFFPLVFILAAVVLARWPWRRNLFVGATAVLVIINIFVSGPILIFREYDGSSSEVARLAKYFTNQDLVLMTPGWEWQKWAYYLKYEHGLNVLPSQEGFENRQEFFNLVSNYERVFVISDQDGQYFPGYSDSQLQLLDSITLKYRAIDKPLWGLSAVIDRDNGRIDVNDLQRQQDQLPPARINEETVPLKIFQLQK